MTEVVNLNVKRANEAGDSRLMTVQDILEETLEQSKDGQWSKCVLLMYRLEGDTYYIDERVAGCTSLESRGIIFTNMKNEILD